jgi:hypothetical protein
MQSSFKVQSYKECKNAKLRCMSKNEAQHINKWKWDEIQSNRAYLGRLKFLSLIRRT